MIAALTTVLHARVEHLMPVPSSLVLTESASFQNGPQLMNNDLLLLHPCQEGFPRSLNNFIYDSVRLPRISRTVTT